MREKINESKKEPLKIQGFTITTLLAYFIIYSIIGFIIETIIFIQTIEKSCYNYYDIFDDRYGNYRNWAKGIFCKTCKRK